MSSSHRRNVFMSFLFFAVLPIVSPYLAFSRTGFDKDVCDCLSTSSRSFNASALELSSAILSASNDRNLEERHQKTMMEK
eukprot:745629-Hanusia_phi.AAC.3